MIRSLAAVVLVAGFGCASAGDWQAGMAVGWETLDGGRADWRAQDVDLRWRADDGLSAWGGWQRVERFGITDHQLRIGARSTVSETTGLSLELADGAEGRLLPGSAWRLAVDARLAAGWIAHLGWREAAYRSDDVRVLDLGLERYAGDWRLAWTLFRGSVAGVDDRGLANMLMLDRYSGERGRIGLWLTTGTEVERVGPATALVTDVDAFGISLQQRLGARFSLRARAGVHRQGPLYTRRGAELGVVVDF